MLEELADLDGGGVGTLLRPEVDLDDAAMGQGPGRARHHALAARDARRAPHRLVEVEGDPRVVSLPGPADDLVIANIIAAPDAAVAEDAGAVIDGDDERR